MQQIRERRAASGGPKRDPLQVKAAKFKLPREQIAKMLAAGCSICGALESKGLYPSLVIDHDHRCCPGGGSCGHCVRGALCRQCNTAIAYLNDDLERVLAAALYLEKGAF